MTTDEEGLYIDMLDYILSGMLSDFKEDGVRLRCMQSLRDFILKPTREEQLAMLKKALDQLSVDVLKLGGFMGEN